MAREKIKVLVVSLQKTSICVECCFESTSKIADEKRSKTANAHANLGPRAKNKVRFAIENLRRCGRDFIDAYIEVMVAFNDTRNDTTDSAIPEEDEAQEEVRPGDAFCERGIGKHRRFG